MFDLLDPIDFDLNHTCRSCLTYGKDLKSIFTDFTTLSTIDAATDSFSSITPLNEVIMSFTQVKIYKDDGMPYNICQSCITQAQTAYAYKKKCEESDVKLRKFYTKVKIKQENYQHDDEHIIDDNRFDDDDHHQSAIDSQDEYVDIKPEVTFNIDPLHEKKKKSAKKKQEKFYKKSAPKRTSRRSQSKKPSIVDYDSDNEDIDPTFNVKFAAEYDPSYENDDAIDEDYYDEYDDGAEEEELASKCKEIDGRYACNMCDKSLADKRTLKLHLRLHTGKNLKECSTCGRGFAKKSHLDRHMMSHIKKEYKCEYCPEVFNNIQDRRHHIAEHVGKKKSGRNKKDLLLMKSKQQIEQLAIVYDSFYVLGAPNESKDCVCTICNQSFRHIAELRKHLAWHTTDEESFININLLTKKQLFDTSEISVETETQSTLIRYIQNALQNGQNQRFYLIVNKNHWELSLSDSETESETEDFLTDEWKQQLHTYQCSKCEKSFDRIHKIIFHMKHEHDSNEFDDRCTYCQKVFPNREILDKHLRNQCENSMKQIECRICRTKFMWKSSRDSHNDHLHLRPKKSSPSSSTINSQKPKEKSFVCEICSKGFYRSEHLERHKNVHLPSEKKFACDLCKKKFNRKDNLKSHMRVHNQDREKDEGDKHLCVYCGRSFSNSSNLIVHMRRHTGEKPYKCDFCEKGFPRSSDLQCHRRTHTGEKPCLCTICGKGFSRSNKLVRHMRIHTGVRPYKCTYCDRAFTQSNDLTLHIRRHTGDKPYVCGVCGDRFIQGTALQTHRRTHGHYEESNQPTPFSSISVNNPNRYTNANRVNRIGIVKPEPITVPSISSNLPPTITIKQESKPPIIVTPLLTPSDNSNHSHIVIPDTPTPTPSPHHQQHLPPHTTASNTSAAASPSASSSGPVSPVGNIHINSGGPLRPPFNFSIPPPPHGTGYLPNGNPFIMQNIDVPNMFQQLSHFQGYN